MHKFSFYNVSQRSYRKKKILAKYLLSPLVTSTFKRKQYGSVKPWCLNNAYSKTTLGKSLKSNENSQ